ncbi:hypothetical protein PV325_003204 [Microctonus aethiopoides]|uniref:Alsin n=1 Tax=Microctonus aethiopoides TaxID=144406 RepID=A0AA39FMD0_9HYME|nr:hypothetical protein PV325_003204 [Microctonus aethiopoides]KAK0171904.1 hypothetical protein PV328_005294 [Microctonus aethiopoides]
MAQQQQLHLWYGTEKVALTFGDQPNGIIKKLVNIKHHLFILTTTFNVYHGEVLFPSNQLPNIIFKRINYWAIDIASNSEHLFIVNDNGYALKINPNDQEIIDTIILKDDIKVCSHGCKQENQIIKIKSISVNDSSALFITENGQLWAYGDQPQIDIQTQIPKRVIFFEGRTISAIDCGINFNVVVARKTPKIAKDDTDSENDVDEIFVSSCPQCLNTIVTSPQSLTSSDTCPLGLHPQPYCEDHSINSISPMSFTPDHNIPLVAPLTNEKDKQMSVVSNINLVSTSDGINCEKEEKKNPIFINTEVAKQFLTRQLSWVSSYGNGKEEANEYISNPTGLLKQNVSNMANLVYEGVKTMGDKVVTLSRHMSGSSETNDIRDDITGDFEHLGEDNCKLTTNSLAHSLRCEEFPWSSSTASLDHELSLQGLNERINSLVDTGNNLLATELWTWGDIKHGQLGTGDIIKRPKPFLITKLQNTGIQKISCGSYHALALTLDGRVYGWGKNDLQQITQDESEILSSPKLMNDCKILSSCNDKRTRDMAAGSRHSLIVVNNNLFFIGKTNIDENVVDLNFNDSMQYCLKYISCSGSYSCCSIVNQNPCEIMNVLICDEEFLEEMLFVNQNLIKPFQKKGGIAQESNTYDTLCRCYTELMSITALNVISLRNYSNHNCEAYEVVVVANVEEFITVYKYYLNIICDVISLGGFAQMAQVLNDLPRIFKSFVIDKLNERDSKILQNEELIATALQYPLKKLNRYKIMISNLIKSNGTNMGIERLQDALVKWEKLCDDQEKYQREAELTKKFWDNSGKSVILLRSPKKRLIRESRTHPISISNQSRFSSHWFILLTDIFIHVIGASHTVHSLQTLWVKILPDSEKLTNALSITTPEESFELYTSSPSERNEWYQALQNAIKWSLPRTVGDGPPRDRNTTYLFLKHESFKDAKYTGRWSNGQVHGFGKMEWADGRLYTGQFNKGNPDGIGKMEIPTQGIYEGQWKDGRQNGYGCFKYINGDVYTGYFKDGLPHGHGTKKEGHFTASVAKIYIGEWVAGLKQGYGVIDDIMTGGKYLGLWNNDMKHGCGLIVTLDGIYYEGVFQQDIMMGHGIMVFEDGTHYEGELKSAGVFGGKGILTFCSGDVLEGNINGAWDEPVKVTATLHINKANPNSVINTKPPSFGKLCITSDEKWKAIFRQCYQQLGLLDLSNRNTTNNVNDKSLTHKLWQNVAVIITKSYEKAMYKDYASLKKSDRELRKNINDRLNKIPQFGRDTLTFNSYCEVHEYLLTAFDSRHHPLGGLLNELATVYTASYGGVRVHPLLLSHAVAELHSITSRIYDIVVLFFPALPPGEGECVLESDDGKEVKVISAAAILHPILLPRVYSSLFVLYALHNKKEDGAYWERLVKWNKQPDTTLMAILGIQQNFLNNMNMTLTVSTIPNSNETFFIEAIETLQQLKTTFSPLEKLLVIRSTFEQMTKTVQKQLGSSYLWTMDELFPVFNFVVVRASVLQLGSEIHFIEDFMERYLENGELGHMFTTLKASYEQILKEKMSIAD